MLSERELSSRCDLNGFGYDPELPHQAAIEVLTEALLDAYTEQREEHPDDRRYGEIAMERLSDSIELLCELRDGNARVVRPGDNAPDPPLTDRTLFPDQEALK